MSPCPLIPWATVNKAPGTSIVVKTPPLNRKPWKLTLVKLPTMSALLTKEAVNQTVDNMGFYNALQACFTLHQLNHAHWAEMHDNKYPIALPQDGIADWKEAPPIVPSVKDKVRA